MSEPTDYVTIKDAAEYLGVSQQAVCNAIAQNRLPHEAKYGKKLIPVDAMVAYKLRSQPNGEKTKGRPKSIVAATSSASSKP